MFNVGQKAAVASAFKLAGYNGKIQVAPFEGDDERVFLLPTQAFHALRDKRDLEQVLQQLLARKVWVVEQTEQGSQAIPFT
jgi:hypothetical protein